MVQGFTFRLDAVKLWKHDIDLLKFELHYHIAVECETCSYTLLKTKPAFIRLNQLLPPENQRDDFASLFQRWNIRPNEKKISAHQAAVSGYVESLNEITDCPPLEEFLELQRHSVSKVTLDTLKCLRGTEVGAESDLPVWEILNCCEEELLLTEKQLHALNHSYEDPQIPFTDLRLALESIWNVRIIGDKFSDQMLEHTYKPSSPHLDLSLFLSVTSLTLQKVDFAGVTSLGSLGDTLHQLSISAEIQELQDVLVWAHEDNEQDTASWNNLKTLDLSHNVIEAMDSSLQILIQLETLNLSHNQLTAINNVAGLPYLRYLDVSHNRLASLDSLHLKLGNVTSLNLAHNHIRSLAGLERLFSIEVLDLQSNLISELQEVSRLTGLPNLELLWLRGNPLVGDTVFGDGDYRVSVLSLFEEEHGSVRLDGKGSERSERRRVARARETRRQVEVHQEETICVVELCEDAAAISYCDLNLQVTTPTPRSRATTLASIVETEEEGGEEDGTGVTLTDAQLREVGNLMKSDGDNWLSRFIDPIFPVIVQEKPKPKQPKVLTVTAESLRTLEPTQGLIRPIKSRDGTESYTTEGSFESRDSRSENRPSPIPPSPKPDFSLFHIVPNGVYNIDETLEELVARYAGLPFSDLQSTYSVYPEETETLRVLGLNPLKPDPELLEVIPQGGVVTWAMGPGDVVSCELVPGDRISILRVGQEAPNVYSMLFLHDLAHLYHLVTQMKGLGSAGGVGEEEEGVDPSERIARGTLDNEEMEEGFHSFPAHCFRYSRADTPLPVVVAVTGSEVVILRLENCHVLSLNQDSLRQLLTSSEVTCSVLYRSKISQIRQVLSSYFRHSVRIEFKVDGSPFGNPETTFSFVGYNESDMEKFKDMLTTALQSEELPAGGGSVQDIIVTETETEMSMLKRILGVRQLDQSICMSVRLERQYFRCLILTEHFLFLLEEDVVRWPPPCFVRHRPLTPRYSVLSKLRLRLIFGLTQYTEIFAGSFVLSLQFYVNLKTFEKGSVDLLMSSFENRERVLGHVGRVWRSYYGKDVKVSGRRRYVMETEEGGDGGAVAVGLTMDSFASISMEALQQFTMEELDDSYNVMYRERSYCIHSQYPSEEFRCAVVMTTENMHVLIPSSADHVTGRHVTPHLTLLLSLPVTNISQIVVGVFEQKIRFEFGWEDAVMVTFMTRDLRMCADLKRAVTDSLDCQYQVDSYESDTLITRRGRELSILALDDDLDNLRFEIAAHSSSTEDYSNVQILAYHLVYLRCGADSTGPGTRSAHGGERRLVSLVLADQAVYIIEEDNIFWPLPITSNFRMPSSVQFSILESIPLDDILCVQYSHFTSCDLVLVYEDREPPLTNGLTADDFCLVEERLGRTVTLETSTYQERESLIRAIKHLKNDELPVSKLE